MAKRLDPFDVEAFGPGPRDIVMRRRPPGELRRIWLWIRAHEWPAQVVLVLMAVTVCYLALVRRGGRGAVAALAVWSRPLVEHSYRVISAQFNTCM
jgi:hypothetical protein